MLSLKTFFNRSVLRNVSKVKVYKKSRSMRR